MKLNFEIVNTYNEGMDMNFVHEPNNLFTKYYISNPFVRNESVIQFIGDDYEPLDYNNLPFQNETNRLTAEAIEKFGVKELPKFGSYGWFTELYTNKNYILAPINATPFQYPFPTIEITQSGATINITITDPDDVAYDAYRLIFREGYFATEFITYEKSISIDSLYNGEYQLSILGYRVDGITSIESKQTTIVITEGADAPEGGPVMGYSPDGTTITLDHNLRLALSNTLQNKISDKLDDVTQEENLITFHADGIEKASAVTSKTIIITLLAEEWEDEIQTVTAEGVTTTNTIIISPIPSHQVMYTSYEILCIGQGTNQLTFKCSGEPLVDIDVQVVIL